MNGSIAWRMLVVCWLAIASYPALASDGIRTVALWPSPDFDISRTGLRPDLNDAGQIAFSRPSFTTHWDSPEIDAADGFGIFLDSSAGLQPLALPADPAPQTDTGVRFVGLGSTAALNNAGQYTFWSYLTGDSIDASNNNGIFTGGADGLRLVAREGDAVPEHPELTFDYLSSGGASMNDLGHLTFSAKLTGPEFDTHANVWGLFSEGFGDGLRLIARDRQQVPGEEEGTLFRFVGGANVNNQGQMLFSSELDVPGSTTRDYALFLQDESGLQTLVKSGQAAPGAAPGVQLGFQWGLNLNEKGQVAFKSLLVDPKAGTESPGVGIFRHENGELEPVALSGQAAPGVSGFRYGRDLGLPLMNDLGQTAFVGSLVSESSDGNLIYSRGIFSETGGQGLRAVITESSPVPGDESGVTFGSLHDVRHKINNLGQTAFTSRLRGTGVNDTNDFGIFVESLERGTQLVARTGDQLDVSNDPAISDLRTIHEIGDGHWFDFNEAGEVAFSIEFTDGSYGVFVAQTIPEPDAGLVMLISVLFLTLIRRPKHMVST